MKQLFIASVSMGKDSLAMLLKLIELQYPLDIVLFYNTGMEFSCIYQIRDRVKELCCNRGIRFVELTPEQPFLYSMFERKIRNKDGSGYHFGYSWCGGPCRWATKHKTEAIRKFKQSLIARYELHYGVTPEIVDYVGIAADEVDRIQKERRKDKQLPLVKWGMTEQDCLIFCRERGWYWYEESPVTPSGYVDLYDILDRVSCWCCANKNLKELRNIYTFLPQYWSRLKNLQSHTARPFHGYYKGQPMGIEELEMRFKNQN